MKGRLAVSTWKESCRGSPSNEKPFMMSSGLEMGNKCLCDAASTRQCSVSKMTPEIHTEGPNTKAQSYKQTEKHTHAYYFTVIILFFIPLLKLILLLGQMFVNVHLVT